MLDSSHEVSVRRICFLRAICRRSHASRAELRPSTRNTYKNARTLQANFLQIYSEGGRVTRTESGVAYFRRPGKMRWEYASPEKNLFVVDGKFAWFFVPADHTVSRVAARDSADWRTRSRFSLAK